MKAKVMKSLMYLYLVAILFFPCSIILECYQVLINGEEYKIRVTAVDPYDPFRGQYVALSSQDIWIPYDEDVIMLESDNRGFLYNVPDGADHGSVYIENLSVDRYFLDERKAPRAERISRELNPDDELYLVLKVWNKKYAITGLHLNGKPIEDFILEEEM